jgi:hypothetical protein
MEYAQKFRRIVVAELAALAVGLLAYALLGERNQVIAFVAGGLVSLTSLLVLGKAIEVVGGGKWGWLPGIAFVGRFALYAWVLSAIIEVYPKLSNELASGLFLSVPAVLLEAVYESFHKT